MPCLYRLYFRLYIAYFSHTKSVDASITTFVKNAVSLKSSCRDCLDHKQGSCAYRPTQFEVLAFKNSRPIQRHWNTIYQNIVLRKQSVLQKNWKHFHSCCKLLTQKNAKTTTMQYKALRMLIKESCRICRFAVKHKIMMKKFRVRQQTCVSRLSLAVPGQLLRIFSWHLLCTAQLHTEQ